MANEWGDEPVGGTGTVVNEWGDRLHDPFDLPPGNLGGIINAARRAGRASLAGIDVMGAMNRAAKRDEYLSEATRLDERAANIDQLAPAWQPEDRTTWAAQARAAAAQLRERAAIMDASASESLASAVKHSQKAKAIPLSPDYEEYQKAEGWNAVKQFLKNPVELPLTIAAEGAAGSLPAIGAGALGAMTAGVPGLAAGTGIGSFATEYASSILDTLREKKIDTEDPDALRAAFADPTVMDEAKKRALARGIPVAVFDAISGGLAGRTVAPAARAGVKAVVKAGAKEVAEQAGLGMAGETAGQVTDQIAAKGTVDLAKLRLKDIVAEGIGELVPGAGQIALGAARRATPEESREPAAKAKTPGQQEEQPGPLNSAGAEDRAVGNTPTPPASAGETTDIEGDISRSLPDTESRDVLTGRSAEATARALKDVTIDFGQTVSAVKDSLLKGNATPAQLDALDFQLRVLEERAGQRKRLKPEQVNASLSNTFLIESLPAAEVFPLVSKLAENTTNIAALRRGIADMRTGTAPAVTPAPNAAPVGTLSVEERAAKAAELRQREQAAAEARKQAEAEREAQRVAAIDADKAKAAKVRAENDRIAAIEKTGRDPDTGRVVDITRVPDSEIDVLDLDAEGITPDQLDKEMERRAKAAERAAALEPDRSQYTWEEYLQQHPLPRNDAVLQGELDSLAEEMTPAQRMKFFRKDKTDLDAAAEAARADFGFSDVATPADVIEHSRRMLRGERVISQVRPDEDGARFRKADRPELAPKEQRDAEFQRWRDNFRLVAPGVLRALELRFGNPEDLVESGDVDAAELTGNEEAVYLRRNGTGLRFIHLFERALRANTDAITRLNLLHELGHAFYDTLDQATKDSLRTLWQHERDSQTGPLFDAEGNLRENVALGVFDAENQEYAIGEWFAERLAHANDRWAKRRIGGRSKGDTLIDTLAADFRALLNRLVEYIEQAFGREGYNDELIRDFRKFLDQGDRWNEPLETLPESLATAGEFATREEKPRVLVAVHNTTAEKLRLMDELGGTPVPSIAIIRRDRSRFTGFGDITLVAPPDLINPAVNRAAKVFNADVYSPRFPTTEYKLNAKSFRAAWKKLEPASARLGHVLSTELDDSEVERKGLQQFEESSAVRLTFLEGKHVKPDLQMRTVEAVPDVLRAFKGSKWDLVDNPDFKRALTEYLTQEAANLPDGLQDVYFDEEGNVSYRLLNDYASRVEYVNKPPEIDRYRTNEALKKQIDDAGLNDEFKSWIKDTFGSVIDGKRVRDYNERTDTVHWLPYNLAAVVRVMKRALRDGEGFNYGVGSIRSIVAKQFRTLEAMRRGADSIIDAAAMEKLKREVNDEFVQIAEELRPFYRFDSSRFGYLDQVSEAFKELAQYGAHKWAENFKPTDPVVMQKVVGFLAKLRDMPTEYFEAKVQRGVFLTEFAGAVVPSDTPQDVRTLLARKGLRLVEYPRSDNEARAKAVDQLAQNTRAAFVRRDDVTLAQSWRTLAEDPAAFQFPTSRAKDPAAIARDLSTPESELTGGMETPDRVVFEAPDDAFIMVLRQRPGGKWKINSVESRPHGAQLYQAAFTWAHNNGHVIEATDLTPINDLRRTSNMLSSALRHGTTRHMEPAQSQGVEWTPGDDTANIAALARREAELVLQKIPAAAEWRYDIDAAGIRDSRGVAVDEGTVRRTLAETGSGMGQHGVGPATLARALLSRAFDGGDAARIGEALARHAKQATTPKVLYARRERVAAGDDERRTPEQLLRDYASLERTRDRYLDEGNRVPRHVLTGLADLREQLEESLPGWRERLKQKQAANAPAPTSATATERASDAEPEQRSGALFDEAGPEIAPEATAAKRSQLEASTLRRPVPLVDWLNHIKSLFVNFRSAIPELPGGAEGRKFMRFRQGYRKIKAATEFVRKDAEEKVAQIVEPLQKLGREAVAPARYRELQELQRIREKQIEDGKPVRKELNARIAEIENELEEVPYHLFRKIVLYRDLFFRSRLIGPSGDPLTLPFNLTAGEVESTLRQLHARLGQSPHREAIEESLRRHYLLVKEVRDGLLERGYVIPEELRNPLYFPHLVLDKTSSRLQRVKLDTAEDFRGYLMQLVGSDRAIESDYVQAMYHHLATVKVHNARQDIVAQYWQPYDIKKQLEAEAKEASARNQEQGRGPVPTGAVR